jgi:hypothetical protein
MRPIRPLRLISFGYLHLPTNSGDSSPCPLPTESLARSPVTISAAQRD